MSKFSRRDFVKIVGGAAAATAVGLPAFTAAAGSKKVVIVGGGTAGATAAKYIKRGDASIDVTVIEPNEHYHTCYLSNEVLGGGRTMDSIKFYTRAQMGRCQGGFCSYKIMKILQRETGLSIEEITKRGGASQLITDRVGALPVQPRDTKSEGQGE